MKKTINKTSIVISLYMLVIAYFTLVTNHWENKYLDSQVQIKELNDENKRLANNQLQLPDFTLDQVDNLLSNKNIDEIISVSYTCKGSY